MSEFRYLSEFKRAALGLCGLITACGDIAQVPVYGEDETSSVWRCVPSFNRVAVKGSLVMHVCPPSDELSPLGRWTGDAICDSSLATADGGIPLCEDDEVRVDITGDANLVTLVDTTFRQGELVLASREVLLPRQEYGNGTPTKYKPIVVLVRHRINDILAQDYAQVVVDGVAGDGATAIQVEAHDRAEVRLSGKAMSLQAKLGERARLDASGLLADTVELIPLGDANGALDIGGRAEAQVCALDALLLSGVPNCNKEAAFGSVTRTLELAACCSASLPEERTPLRSLGCAHDPLQQCVGLPVCGGAEASYVDCAPSGT